MNEHLESDHHEPDAPGRHRLGRAVAACAAVGGLYGAALGSVLPIEGASRVIGMGAAIMALLGLASAANYGRYFATGGDARFRRLFIAVVGAVSGLILGGFFGIIAFAPLGAIAGGIAGGVLGRLFARTERRRLASMAAAIAGACVGAVSLMVRRDQTAAGQAALTGLAIGAACGALLFLLFLAALRALRDDS